MFFTSIKKTFFNFNDYKGRASRREYWYFFLFLVALFSITTFIDMSTGTFNPKTGRGTTGILAFLLIIIPNITLTIRRIHDSNRSGWWALALLIPFAGSILIFIFAVIKGTPGVNRFGNDPLSNNENNNKKSDSIVL